MRARGAGLTLAPLSQSGFKIRAETGARAVYAPLAYLGPNRRRRRRRRRREQFITVIVLCGRRQSGRLNYRPQERPACGRRGPGGFKLTLAIVCAGPPHTSRAERAERKGSGAPATSFTAQATLAAALLLLLLLSLFPSSLLRPPTFALPPLGQPHAIDHRRPKPKLGRLKKAARLHLPRPNQPTQLGRREASLNQHLPPAQRHFRRFAAAAAAAAATLLRA